MEEKFTYFIELRIAGRLWKSMERVRPTSGAWYSHYVRLHDEETLLRFQLVQEVTDFPTKRITFKYEMIKEGSCE